MTTPSGKTLETLLKEARSRIEVSAEELDEAKSRRSAIKAALRKEFPGSRTYNNGSVAHGDALTPLNDVDLGVIVPNPDGKYGPGKLGPSKLKKRAYEAIRRELKPTYGNLRVEVKGQKRSVLIRFRDPIREGWEDFTADVIVAMENPQGEGLLIPCHNTWDCSDPIAHTGLVVEANKATSTTYSKAVRLIKHWNRGIYDAPLHSWHIKALAFESIREHATMLEALRAWFQESAEKMREGDTADPAGVGPDIIARTGRRDARKRLLAASERLEDAISLEKQGYGVLAHEALAKLFNDEDMLPTPAKSQVKEQEAERLRTTARSIGASSIAGSKTTADALPRVRSWAP